MNQDSPKATELKEAAAHGVRWSAISRPTVEFLQLASMIVLARLIVPAEFGRFAVASIALEIASLTVAGGLSSALVQRKVADREHLQTGSALALISGFGLTAATLLVAGLVVGPVFGDRTAQFMQLMAPLCLIAALSAVPMALLRRRMAFRRLSEIEMLSTFVRVGLSVGLALAGMTGEALVIGVLAGSATATGAAMLSGPAPFPRFSPRAARDLLGYALPMSLASITWVGFSNVDYAVIGARLGVAQTGLYFRAYTLAVEYQSKIGMVMTQVGFPVLSRTADAGEMARMHHQMVRLLTLVLFPLLVLLAIGAPVLVPFVFGSNWDAAIVPVQILALGGASTVLIDAAGTVLMAAGRARALLAFGAAHFIVYGVTVYLVSPLGISAIAIDAAIVHTAFLFVSYVLMQRESGQPALERLWNDVAPAFVSCIGLAAVALPVSRALSAANLPPALWLLALAVVAAATYLLTLRTCFAGTWRAHRAILARLIPWRRFAVVVAPQGA